MTAAERQAAIDELQQCRAPLTVLQTDQLREVFPAIFRSNFERVWEQLRRRGFEDTEAKDVFQNTFLTAFTKLVELGFPENLTTYIYTIAKRQILNHVRDTRFELALFSIGLPSSSSMRPLSSGRRAERATLYEEMARRLTPEQRKVFEAVEIHGLTHEEAAGLLGIAEGTVKSRLRIAKREMVALTGEVLPPTDRGDE